MNNTPPNARRHGAIQKASRLSAHGKDKKAMEHIKNHLRSYPNDLDALNLAGTLAARLED